MISLDLPAAALPQPNSALRAIGERARAAMQKEPLMTLRDALRLLADFHLTQRDLLARIENLELPWAWNIASSDARLRAVRLLPAGVRDLRQCLATGVSPGTRPAPAFATVIGLVLPPSGRSTLSTPEAAGILNCGSMHILHLLQQGALQLAPGCVYHRGRTGAARITRASLETFLRDRVLVRHIAAEET